MPVNTFELYLVEHVWRSKYRPNSEKELFCNVMEAIIIFILNE